MIVGFHGRLGSGKDTAGERLASLVDLPSYRISFAAKLKESSAALLDIDPVDWETYKNDPEAKIILAVGWKPATADGPEPVVVHWEGYELEEPNVLREFTAREFLQRYGTESHRDIFGFDFWVEQAVLDYRPSPDEFAYVTDVRFVNEAAAIRALQGVVIRVIGQDDGESSHASEISLPEELVTFEIDNTARNDDYASLDEQLRSIASVIGLPLKVYSSR